MEAVINFEMPSQVETCKLLCCYVLYGYTYILLGFSNSPISVYNIQMSTGLVEQLVRDVGKVLYFDRRGETIFNERSYQGCRREESQAETKQ